MVMWGEGVRVGEEKVGFGFLVVFVSGEVLFPGIFSRRKSKYKGSVYGKCSRG